jgi:hypothetical protein
LPPSEAWKQSRHAVRKLPVLPATCPDNMQFQLEVFVPAPVFVISMA